MGGWGGDVVIDVLFLHHCVPTVVHCVIISDQYETISDYNVTIPDHHMMVMVTW